MGGRRRYSGPRLQHCIAERQGVRAALRGGWSGGGAGAGEVCGGSRGRVVKEPSGKSDVGSWSTLLLYDSRRSGSKCCNDRVQLLDAPVGSPQWGPSLRYYQLRLFTSASSKRGAVARTVGLKRGPWLHTPSSLSTYHASRRRPRVGPLGRMMAGGHSLGALGEPQDRLSFRAALQNRTVPSPPLGPSRRMTSWW